MSNKICDFLCLPSLFSIIFLKFVKSTAYFRTLFLFTADWYYIVANLFCLHIDQLDIWVISTFDYCEWFCCDYMCTGIRFSTCFQFFGCVFRIITTESYGNSWNLRSWGTATLSFSAVEPLYIPTSNV